MVCLFFQLSSSNIAFHLDSSHRNKWNFIFSLRVGPTRLDGYSGCIFWAAITSSPDTLGSALWSQWYVIWASDGPDNSAELVCSSVADLHKWKSLSRKMRRLIESGYKISISLACIFTPTFCCAGCGSTTDAQLMSYGAHAAFEILNC